MSTVRQSLALAFTIVYAILSSSIAQALETSLYDIELSSDYSRAVRIMRDTLKYPATEGQAPDPFTNFTVTPQGHQITIFSDEKGRVTKIRASGDTPLAKLNFLGSINLGNSASNIEAQAGLPAVPQAKSDGSRFYIFGNSNFAIETKAGKISSISVYLTNREQIKADSLKNYCSYRHPIWQQGDFFYTQVNLDLKGQSKSVVAQINTGSKISTMSHALCRKFNCKATAAQQGNIQLGLDSPFKKNEPLTVDSPKVLGRNFDISLGTDFLYSFPMLLNLQHDYICQPRVPLKQISTYLQLSKLPIKPDEDTYLIPIKLLGTNQTWVRFDSGNRDMALDQKSIKFLQSAKQPLLYFPSGKSLGTYSTKLKFLVGDVTNEADKFYVSPLARYQKLGAKQMTGILWGFDIANQTVYVGK